MGTVALAIAIGCEQAPAPSPTPEVLIIAPHPSVLKVADSARLTAAVVSANGSRAASAVFVSSSDDVVRIDSSGLTTAMKVGEATITATANGLSAITAISVVSNISGTWTGTQRITRCTQVSGAPPSPCRFVVGCCLPMEMDVQQTGDQLTGIIRFYSSLKFSVWSGPYTGLISRVGEVSVTAKEIALIGPSDFGGSDVFTIDTWQSALNAQQDKIAGQMTLTETYRNLFGPQVLAQTADFEIKR